MVKAAHGNASISAKAGNTIANNIGDAKKIYNFTRKLQEHPRGGPTQRVFITYITSCSRQRVRHEHIYP